MEPTNPENASPSDAVAPCGPECRYAEALPDCLDYLWCSLQGAPRKLDSNVDCRNFQPRSAGAVAYAAPPVPARPGEIAGRP